MRKDARILLHNQVDVAQGNILNLALSRQKGDKWGRHLLVQGLDCCLVLNQVQLLQDDLRERTVLSQACSIKHHFSCFTRSCSNAAETTMSRAGQHPQKVSMMRDAKCICSQAAILMHVVSCLSRTPHLDS